MDGFNDVRMDEMNGSANRREPSEMLERKPKEKPSFSQKSPKKQKNHKMPKKGVWKIVAIALLAVVVLGLAGWGIYSYMELQKIQNPEYTQQQAEQENQTLKNKVSRLIELPDGEMVVATVSDKEKLVDQPFFSKAENGDKVLIFSESSTAIIYRESTDKIVNSGPIAITSAEDGTEATQ